MAGQWPWPITDALVCLYWLRMSQRIEFKLAVLTYNSCSIKHHVTASCAWQASTPFCQVANTDRLLVPSVAAVDLSSRCTSYLERSVNSAQSLYFLAASEDLSLSAILSGHRYLVTASIVSSQWKSAQIHPIPKVVVPKSHTDFRPISVTPVLSRLIEERVVRQFLYSAFLNPFTTLDFQTNLPFDQLVALLQLS